MRGGNSQGGFTYLAVLITVATMGAALAAFGELASHAAQREKEQQLLFAGNQFRQAIAAYYEGTPAVVKRYPRSLEDLLEDDRFPTPRRYLRKIYRDPFTGEAEWGLMQAPDGRIMGVHSLSDKQPIKTGGFAFRDRSLEGEARYYSDWGFFYSGYSPIGPAQQR